MRPPLKALDVARAESAPDALTVTEVAPAVAAVPTSPASHAWVVPFVSALDLLWPTPMMPPAMPVVDAVALLVDRAVIWIAPEALKSPATYACVVGEFLANESPPLSANRIAPDEAWDDAVA